MEYLNTVMKKIIIFLLLVMVSALAFGENPKAYLTYFSNYREVEVFDFTGKKISPIYEGIPLLIGYGIKTGRSTAEIELRPNGTIVKLQENSFLKIEDLQGAKGGKTNRFALVKGWLRTVASKLFNTSYSVVTPSTVLGVRGTDFIVTLDNDNSAEVLVREGKLDMFNPADRSVISVRGGEAAAAKQQTLRKIDLETREIVERNRALQFESLAPESVPRKAPDWYTVQFDYFKDFDYQAFQQFFADDNFFDDYEKYVEQYREYYREEMKDFEERFEQEKRSFEDYKNKEAESFNNYESRGY